MTPQTEFKRKCCGSTKPAVAVDEVKNPYRTLVIYACADCGKELNPEDRKYGSNILTIQ